MLSSEGPGANTNQTDPVHAQTTEYGPSDYDTRHRVTASGLWMLPIFPHDKGLLHTFLGGWQLGGILTAYSGFRRTPVTGFLTSVAPVTSAATIAPVHARPNITETPTKNDTSNSCFIEGCMFGCTNQSVADTGKNNINIANAGPTGNGRNSFRGPGFFSTDASLGKRFALPILGEASGIEIRAYAFNVFNQLNLTPFQFGDLDAHVENANFGRPSSALAGRSIELQARFTF